MFFPEEANLILSIPLSFFHLPDELFWCKDPKGVFTTKSAYFVARTCSDICGEVPVGSEMPAEIKFLWKALWRAKVPEKIKICIWRGCLNALPSRANLKLKKAVQDNCCVEMWVAQMASLMSRESFDLILMLMWNIWKARNELLWQGSTLPPQDLQIQAHTWLLEFKKWNVVQPKPKVVEVDKWRRPEVGWLKCNFDGAWDEPNNRGGAILIIRDTDKDFVATMALPLEGITSALMAEVAAAREAALFLLKWSRAKVLLEGDALLVIAAIQNNSEVNYGALGHILTDTRRLLQWKAMFVRCGANAVAHRLAHHGLYLVQPVSFEEPPDVISDLILEDNL
nr:uncharacterized protein LOC103403753 [Malus domestica]